MNEGFIQIHRKITEWEWYKDANTYRLFLHCLLLANWKDKKWQGIIIKRGSFITSNPILSKELRIGVMQVRTSVNKLKLTGELTVKTTNKYSVVTVINYNRYQKNNSQNNTQVTGKQQASNRQVTTTNKYNKDNKVNKDNNVTTNVVTKVFGNPDINEVSDYFLKTMKIPKEDCTQQQSRRYWNLLLKESKKGVAGVMWLIDLASKDKYLGPNITSSKDLYYKRIKLISRKRGEQSGKSIVTKIS